MIVRLPDNIDYSKYNSDSGMSTRYWGCRLWGCLFVSILGRYPIRIKTQNDLKMKRAFKNILSNLSIIMPCIFCRESFKIFIKELPIEPYLIGRIELMYWLYLMKEKVNIKLRNQEKKCYIDEKKRLKKMYYSKEITKVEYYKKVLECKNEIFVTAKTPTFKEVLDKYESQRARCDKRAKKCSILKNQKVSK